MTTHTDLSQYHRWLNLPPKLRACLELARLDRPIGSWLLLFPCLWSLALAGSTDWHLYLWFGLGAFIMRGAGCTLNDLIDRRLDAGVERTRGRPLPSGRIGVTQACLFLALQLALGLAILLQFNHAAIAWGAASLLLVVIYPFMKRFTWWPQLVLGLAFNWGALLGWVAWRGQVETPAIILYLAGIAWTLGYDTIYAQQDIVDDTRLGIKSTARRFGHYTKGLVAAFYGLSYGLLAVAGWLAGTGPIFDAMLVVVTIYTTTLLKSWNLASPASALARFKANRFIGLLIFAALVFSRRCPYMIHL